MVVLLSLPHPPVRSFPYHPSLCLCSLCIPRCLLCAHPAGISVLGTIGSSPRIAQKRFNVSPHLNRWPCGVSLWSGAMGHVALYVVCPPPLLRWSSPGASSAVCQHRFCSAIHPAATAVGGGGSGIITVGAPPSRQFTLSVVAKVATSGLQHRLSGGAAQPAAVAHRQRECAGGGGRPEGGKEAGKRSEGGKQGGARGEDSVRD